MTETNLRNEVDGTTAEFEFRGETFTVPLEYADYPLAFIEAAVDGKALAIQARELLGPEQWARIRAFNLTGRDLEPLHNAIEGAMGTTSGNSPASSD